MMWKFGQVWKLWEKMTGGHKLSTYVEQSTQNEIEYVKWSTYIKILVHIANNMLKKKKTSK